MPQRPTDLIRSAERAERRRRLSARVRAMGVARGEETADLCVIGGKLINVYSGEIYPANVSIVADRIAYVGPEIQGAGQTTTVIDAGGKFLAPGYVEPHTHLWTLYNPVSALESLLPNGTTTAVSDDLGFRQTMSMPHFLGLIEYLSDLPVRYYWLLRPMLEPWADRSSGDRLSLSQFKIALKHPRVLGLAEINRWMEIYRGDSQLMDLFAEAESHHAICDGHTAGASARRLQTLSAAGVLSCHEATTSEETLDRCRLGLWTMLRHSSLRPDLPALVDALDDLGSSTQRLMVTTDGSSPDFADETRHIAGMLEMMVSSGHDPVKALQLATLNPATYLGLSNEVGGIAPGRRADILILPELGRFTPDDVIAGGKLVLQNRTLTTAIPELDWLQYHTNAKFSLSGPAQSSKFYVARHPGTFTSIPVMTLTSAAITRRQDMQLPEHDEAIDLSSDPMLLYATLLDRHGQWVTRGVVSNLACIGGLASSFNTSGNLLVIGQSPHDMAIAAKRVSALGGGFALVENSQIIWEYALPICGVMSDRSFDEVADAARTLGELLRARGYQFNDALYTIEFLACDFLPELRLTARGLVSVKTDQVLYPSSRWAIAIP